MASMYRFSSMDILHRQAPLTFGLCEAWSPLVLPNKQQKSTCFNFFSSISPQIILLIFRAEITPKFSPANFFSAFSAGFIFPPPCAAQSQGQESDTSIPWLNDPGVTFHFRKATHIFFRKTTQPLGWARSAEGVQSLFTGKKIFGAGVGVCVLKCLKTHFFGK